MAIIIPAAAIKFPLRAVSGLDNILRPSIKVTEAMRYDSVSKLSSIIEAPSISPEEGRKGEDCVED
jgi:hypothetical protein